MLWIEGNNDPKNPDKGHPPKDAQSFRRLGMQETLDFWLDKHSCNARKETSRNRPDRPEDRTRVIEKKYEGCRTPFEFLLVDGGGHSWPGRGEHEEKETHCTDVDGAEEALAFWRANAGLVTR
jgi:poly(3-hydroxybutyrate) depolymerase